MTRAAQARALDDRAGANVVGAVPRDYNFAADILEQNLKAGRADKAVFSATVTIWIHYVNKTIITIV